MATSRLLVEYDGTNFAGWALQPGLRTVQGELQRALAVLARREVTLTVAGRTDAGVHAWGQVVSYEGEPVDRASMNGLLPDDVAVLESEAAPDGFNARYHAVSRTYCYRVLRRAARSPLRLRTALHVRADLDRDALDACARDLVGTHDFTAFTPVETHHKSFVREVRSASWVADGDQLEFWIEATSFLRNMNRALVGTMLQIARGDREQTDFAALLDGAPRTAAGPTAPAHGLALASVRYPDEPDPPLS